MKYGNGLSCQPALFAVFQYVLLEPSSRITRCALLYATRAAMAAAACASMTSVGLTNGMSEPPARPISPKWLLLLTCGGL